jgi:hypothetical protein
MRQEIQEGVSQSKNGIHSTVTYPGMRNIDSEMNDAIKHILGMR